MNCYTLALIVSLLVSWTFVSAQELAPLDFNGNQTTVFGACTSCHDGYYEVKKALTDDGSQGIVIRNKCNQDWSFKYKTRNGKDSKWSEEFTVKIEAGKHLNISVMEGEINAIMILNINNNQNCDEGVNLKQWRIFLYDMMTEETVPD